MPQFQPYNPLEALRRRQSPSNYTAQLGPEGGAEAVGVSRAQAPANLFDIMGRQADEERIAAADAAQRKEIEAVRGAQVGSRMRGFDDPQAEAQYGREFDVMKAQVPVQAARESASVAMDKLLAQQGAQDARTAAQIESRERIAGAGQAGQTARTAMNISPTLMRDLQTNRQSLRGVEGGIVPDWLQGVTGKRQNYETALTAVLREMGTLEDVMGLAQVAAQQGMSPDDIIAAVSELGDTLDPIEEEALRFFVGGNR